MSGGGRGIGRGIRPAKVRLKKAGFSWDKTMLKKFACLFVLFILSLAVGCAAKPRLATPEDVLREIASSRWEIDFDASMKMDSAVRRMVNDEGEEEVAREYGQLRFDINLQTQKFDWYDSPGVLVESPQFVLAPETSEDKAAWEEGIRQVRLKMGEGARITYTLRYEDNDMVSFFKDGKLGGVFSRLKE